VNGKVLIFRLQILGCDENGEISIIMGMGNFCEDGEFLTRTEWGRKKFYGDGAGIGDNLTYRVTL